MSSENLSTLLFIYIFFFFMSETVQIFTYAMILVSPLIFFGYMILT